MSFWAGVALGVSATGVVALAAYGFMEFFEQTARVLVEAGATYASAARAAVILESGGDLRDASAVLVIEETPATFDAQLLFAAMLRQERELVGVRRV